MSRFSRFSVVLMLVALFGVALWAVMPTNAAAPQGMNEATIVVTFDAETTIVRTVTFTESSISGLEALNRAFEVESAEGAICKIENTGCPATDCFCAFPPNFWGYSHRTNGEWVFADTGAADYLVTNGAVEGWQWAAPLPAVPTDTLLASQVALDWMRPQQQANGSYANSVGPTLDVIAAVAAANNDPAAWALADGASLTDYVAANGLAYATGVARQGKLAYALAAADLDPRDFVGADLVLSMTANYNPATGAFGTSNWDQALAMMGWRAAGEQIPMTATNQLISRVNSDGGWGFSPGGSSDVDSTALMLEALYAAGEPMTSTVYSNALGYLQAAQQPDGGLPYEPTSDSNTNSTGFALQGIIAAGGDPLGSEWTITGTNPITYLLGQQTIEGGFAYTSTAEGPDLFATVQGLPGLVGKPFPYLSKSVAQRNAVEWVISQQQADGSFAGFNPGATLDAVMALNAAGIDPETVVSSAGNTPLDYLTGIAATYGATGASAASKLTVGVLAAGGNPRNLNGFDAVAALNGFYNADTGVFGAGDAFSQAWGVLAYVATEQDVPAAAIDRIEATQTEDGGWGFDDASPADADSTALLLQAVAAAGVPVNDMMVDAALGYLQDVQNGDGGFPGFDTLTSASTTGLVLQALAAYDQADDGLAWTTVITDGSASALTLQTPIDRLLSLQSFEGGFAGFGGANDAYATYQSLIGVTGTPYVSPAEPRDPVLYLPLIQVQR